MIDYNISICDACDNLERLIEKSKGGIMNKGDIIAFGKDNKVDLLCRVEGGNISNIRMTVLNGLWRLEYTHQRI